MFNKDAYAYAACCMQGIAVIRQKAMWQTQAMGQKFGRVQAAQDSSRPADSSAIKAGDNLFEVHAHGMAWYGVA